MIFIETARYDTILNNIEQGVIVIDDQSKVILFNEKALLLTKGFMKGPIHEGDHILDLQLPEHWDTVSKIIRNLQLKRQPRKSSFQFTNPNGTRIFLELNYVPVVDDGGNISNIDLFITDVTEQKVFQKKLEAQASSISNLTEKANAIIISIDTLGFVTDWNAHCTKVTGFEKNEAYAQKMASILFTEAERPFFDKLVERMLNNESIDNQELAIQTKEGKRIILLLSGTPRKSSNEEIIGLTFVGHDVTELTEYRKSLEKKILERTSELRRSLKTEQEAVELKTRFVSMASHEFRTPLSSIQVASNYLKKTFGKIEVGTFQTKIDDIQNQIGHMTYLLDDVLNYGKSEQGKLRLMVTKVKVTDFVNKIIEEVGNSTQNTHAILLECGNAPIEFMTDETLTRNALINLLTNAIKFSPGKNNVFLKLEGNEEQLTITVRDEGIGIDEVEMEKIFEPFTRGRNVGSTEGTGLGLSIVKRTVESVGGTIQATSQLGEGSTFIISIPNQLQ